MKLKKCWRELSIFLFSVFLRVPRLGTDIFNADAFRWKTRSYNFSNGFFGLDFAQTAQVPHPGVVLMWLGALGIKIYNAFNDLFRSQLPSGSQQILELHFVQKLLVVLVLSFLFALSFFLLRKLTNDTIAFFSIFLLSIEPYFLAHTRVFHLDALLSMLMFVSVLSLLCYFDSLRNLDGEVGSKGEKPGNSSKPGFKISPKAWLFPCPALGNSPPTYLIISTVSAGLALLTKSTALFIIPFVGLLVLLEWVINRRRKNPSRFIGTVEECGGLLVGSMLLSFGIWILVLAVTFTALWPATWIQPVETLQLYFSGIAGEGFAGHGVYFWGQWTTNPGWTFYPLSLWIRLSPWLLVAGVLGAVTLFKRNVVATFRSRFSGEAGTSPATTKEAGPYFAKATKGRQGAAATTKDQRGGGASHTAKAKRDKCPAPTKGKNVAARPWRANRQDRERRLKFATIFFVFLFLIFITIPTKKLERYVLPTYPFFAVLAGYGFYYLRRRLENLNFCHLSLPVLSFVEGFRISDFEFRIYRRTIDFAVTAVLLILFVTSTHKIFPDYLAYYSPLAGGLRGATKIIRPDWSFGAWRVGEWLNSQPRKKPLLDVVVPETNQFRPFIEGRVEDSRFADKEEFGRYDYVIFPVWSERNSELGAEPVKIIRIAGVGVYNIYRFGK